MNARFAIASLSLLATSWSGAQNVTQEPPEDPVQAAIREFNSKVSNKNNEVTVVLPPPSEEPAPKSAQAKPSSEDSPKPSVLVTGTPPDEAEIVPEPAPPAAFADETSSESRKGLTVRVENLRIGTGSIDPTKVKLLAPFPAKPLAQPPTGWRLEASDDAPPITREVELSPGKHITLTVRPHLLVPDMDGADVFTVPEPGFDSSLGYRQSATVGAVLARSIRQLDDDTKELGNVIDNLQQLLVSLPKPEPTPER